MCIRDRDYTDAEINAIFNKVYGGTELTLSLIHISGLPAQAFVHYGNFIGETRKIAAKLKVPLVTLGIMIGKAVKLAEGNLDTHSKKVVMNKEFLRQVAMEAGCSPDVESMIERLTLARELWTLLSEEDGGKFFPCLLEHCFAHCVPLLPEGKLTILLIDEEGNIPFRIQ